MQEFLFQKDSYSLTNSEKYNLSIQVSLNGFSFIIQNSETLGIELISYTPLKLSGDYGLLKKSEEQIRINGLSGVQYHLVTIIVSTNHARIIPSEYSNEKIYRQFPGFKSKIPKGTQIITASVTDKSHLVFLTNSGLYDYFFSTFPGCIIVHEMIPLLKSAISDNRPETIILDCVFRNQYISISTVSKQEVLFFNSFNIRSQNDVLFFVASVLKIFQGKEFVIYCSGNIDNEKGYLLALNKYFKNVRIRNFADNQPEMAYMANLPYQKISALLTNSNI